ncbi:hypothetical protein LVJ94_49830 [Pendulispora rubella]|uniref:Uncharacterized protein n=1 Tax=Pendulispora rubella TaxID=2741070 RepID=A0ABZ2L2L0_9BACT
MKTALFILALSLFACGASDDESASRESSEQGQSELQEIDTCSSGGGTCRKSQCRANEALSNTLECGHEQACCVPAPAKVLQTDCAPAAACW